MKLLFFLKILLLFNTLFSGVVNEGLKQIPIQDVFLIREFVKTNFKWHQAVHPIFFQNKPMCLATGVFNGPDTSLRDILWKKGLEAFRKYEYLFPHPNFLFISNFHEEDEKGYQYIDLFIINKYALSKCFRRYITVFKSILGEDFDYESLISDLDKKAVNEIIKNDQVLLGILLGYGEESSKAFNNHQIQKLEYYFLRTDIYCRNFPKISEKCDYFPVVFMGNPQSNEVQELVSLYGRELEIFCNSFWNKDPLMIFLESICEEDGDILHCTFTNKKKSIFEFAFHIIFNPFSVKYNR